MRSLRFGSSDRNHARLIEGTNAATIPIIEARLARDVSNKFDS